MTKKELLELLESMPDGAITMVVIPHFDMPTDLGDKKLFSWVLDGVELRNGIIELRTPGTEEDFASEEI